MCALKSIRQLCDAGREAHEAGNVAGAEFYLRQAHAQAKGLKSPVLEAKILNTMAVFALAQGKAAKAAPLLDEAREKVAARVGTSNKLYQVISGNLRQARETIGA